MTDKTEAQPEALRLAETLHAESERQSTGVKYSTAKKSAAELRRQHTEIQQLKAQLSARQAVQDGWRLVPVEPDSNMKRAAQKALMDHSPHSEWLEEEWPDGLRMWNGMLSAAPLPPKREPQKHAENRELAETALRFVDRAGDVHPGIDDADRICGEFHTAMMEVIEKWHPMPMPVRIGAANAR